MVHLKPLRNPVTLSDTWVSRLESRFTRDYGPEVRVDPNVRSVDTDGPEPMCRVWIRSGTGKRYSEKVRVPRGELHGIDGEAVA